MQFNVDVTVRFKQTHPSPPVSKKISNGFYKAGVKFTKQAMAEVENQIQRLTCFQVQDE